MESIAVKSGMRGMERSTVPGSQPDRAPGGNPGGIEGHGAEVDPPISHFVHQDENGHHHINLTKVAEHLHGTRLTSGEPAAAALAGGVK